MIEHKFTDIVAEHSGSGVLNLAKVVKIYYSLMVEDFSNFAEIMEKKTLALAT